VLSLASPGLAVRGKPVRRAKGPLDPWQVSGSPMASPFAGRSTFPGSPTPVRRVPFFACPKQGTERKGTPDSTPANPAGPLARRSAQKVRPRHIPVCLGRTRGSVPRNFVLALRSPSSLGLSKGVPKQNKMHPNTVSTPVEEDRALDLFLLTAFAERSAEGRAG